MSADLEAVFSKRFASGPTIEVAFRMPAAGFGITVLFGPSGAGKTTVLRCLAGLERPDQGTIRFGGQVWFDAVTGNYMAPQRRGVGHVAQDYALFPHLSAAANVGYGLKHLPPGERSRRVAEIINLVGLGGLEERKPSQLSGGEQQRVALARALVRRPQLLLLDEPLAALDAPTREQLRRQLRRLLREWGKPTVLVTHDRIEALALGDTVVLMEAGKVRQTGSVREVFGRPADAAAARIVGVETVAEGRVVSVQDGLATVAIGSARVVALAPETDVTDCTVCIRAEDVTLEKGMTAATSARNRLNGRVLSSVHEGPLVRVNLDCGFELTALVTTQSAQELDLCEGAAVTALVKAPAIHLIARG
jgi:molybdate transport system ATP-binding protein